jgi:TolB-like protein
VSSALLSRLRERKLVQWALAYLAGAWVLLQLITLLGTTYAWPSWLLRSAPVLLAVGFVATLVLAWYHGEKGRQRASGTELLMLGALLVIAGAAVTWVGRGAERPLAAEEPSGSAGAMVEGKSLAVLPFADLSEGRDQEWFSDGLTEEILNTLARLGELRGSARNSSFQFKNRAVDAREVGRQLGVAHLLEGSVRRSGDRLRIAAQLIRAGDGFQLWSHSYDRHLDDVFAVQMDIAENIARVLDVVLDDARRERMVATGTRDPEAFLYYLRGRAEYEAAHALGLDTNDRLWDGNTWFERALAIDPAYALARFYHHDAYYHALIGDILVPPRYHGADGDPDLARLERLMRDDLDGALVAAGEAGYGRALRLTIDFIRGEWRGLAAEFTAFDAADATENVEIVDTGFLWYPLQIMRSYDGTRTLVRWGLARNPLDAGWWSQLIDLELQTGNTAEAGRLLAEAAGKGLEHRFLTESRVRYLIRTGRAHEVLSAEIPRLRGTRLYWWAAAYAHVELGNRAEARAILHSEEAAWQVREFRCWLLARMGDQPEANACAADLDARPLSWVQFARMISDGGSVPFDPEAAPRFTALYRSSGGAPWPRTQPVREARR